MKNLFLILLFLPILTATAQEEKPQYVILEKSYKYRVYFTDKDHNDYSVRHPEEFLSSKSLERRKRLKIKVDKHDLPVSTSYLEYLRQHGFKVIQVSKWNNTAVVEAPPSKDLSPLKEADFIESFKKVWESPDSILTTKTSNRFNDIENHSTTCVPYYGAAQSQNKMLNLDSLHLIGYKGKGMTIAVIDAGFYNSDTICGLKDCHIMGIRNFLNTNRSVYEVREEHGTMVLSCMAAHLPNRFVGTAPEANYYLLVSEDNTSEQLVEEDYWCAAVEYADSLGVDVVTSSLGYYKFDTPEMCHKYHELDGETALNSRSASLAASRGMLLINSAGNEGDEFWKKIGFPADAKDILTVGAVTSDSINTFFSSVGNTADGRIKPDVMAQGLYSCVLDSHGNVTTANGTSFSAPILCGAVTCLWQASPHTQPKKLIEIIQRASHNAEHPNNIFGYGIPNLWKAYQLLIER